MEDSGKAPQAQAGDAGRGQDLQWGRHGPHHRGLQYQARDGNFLLFPLTVESVLHIQLLPRPGGSPRQGVPNPEGPHTPWKEAAASVFSVTTQGCQPGVAGPFVFAKGKSEIWMSMRTQNLSRLAPTWARGLLPGQLEQWETVSKEWRGLGSSAHSRLAWVESLSPCLQGLGGAAWGSRARGFLEASGFQQPLCMGPAASGTT